MNTLRKHLLSLLLIVSVNASYCQNDTTYKLLKQLAYPVMYFTTSPTGELFTINTGNQLKKYDSNGDSMGVFNDVKKYGKLAYVVAQNPWKTLLYYKDFETIVILDKYLKVLGSLNLRNKNIFEVQAITSSYDNNIWIYDPVEMKIKKLDENGNILSASTDLRQVFEQAPQPTKIIDKDGLLYLFDPQRGIFIFDYYGAFKSMLPIQGWNTFFLVGKTIYGISNSSIYSNQPPTPVASARPLPDFLQYAEEINLSQKKLWMLKDKKLSIYEVR